jgi:hypothetical protein
MRSVFRVVILSVLIVAALSAQPVSDPLGSIGTGQQGTSLTHPDGRALDADAIRYFVMPNDSRTDAGFGSEMSRRWSIAVISSLRCLATTGPRRSSAKAPSRCIVRWVTR